MPQEAEQLSEKSERINGPKAEYKADGELIKLLPRVGTVHSKVLCGCKEAHANVDTRIEEFEVRLIFDKNTNLNESILVDGETGRIYWVNNRTCWIIIEPQEFLRTMCLAKPEERPMQCREKDPAMFDCASTCPMWEPEERGTVEDSEESVDPTNRNTVWTDRWRMVFRRRRFGMVDLSQCPPYGQLNRVVSDDQNIPD